MPSNYRPVALLSNFDKVLERIIFKQMYNHLTAIIYYININQDFDLDILLHSN